MLKMYANGSAAAAAAWPAARRDGTAARRGTMMMRPTSARGPFLAPGTSPCGLRGRPAAVLLLVAAMGLLSLYVTSYGRRDAGGGSGPSSTLPRPPHSPLQQQSGDPAPGGGGGGGRTAGGTRAPTEELQALQRQIGAVCTVCGQHRSSQR
jgi:hypothetical protein